MFEDCDMVQEKEIKKPRKEKDKTPKECDIFIGFKKKAKK
jgi:hypothetical protein